MEEGDIVLAKKISNPNKLLRGQTTRWVSLTAKGNFLVMVLGHVDKKERMPTNLEVKEIMMSEVGWVQFPDVEEFFGAKEYKKFTDFIRKKYDDLAAKEKEVKP